MSLISYYPIEAQLRQLLLQEQKCLLLPQVKVIRSFAGHLQRRRADTSSNLFLRVQVLRPFWLNYSDESMDLSWFVSISSQVSALDAEHLLSAEAGATAVLMLSTYYLQRLGLLPY
jgi:hypothetical protein